MTSPVISGWYEWSPPDGGLGAITKWIRQTFGASGTEQDFNTLTRGDYYHAIHLFPPTGANVDKVRLTADGVIFQDVINALENQAMLINRGLNPDLTEGGLTWCWTPTTRSTAPCPQRESTSCRCTSSTTRQPAATWSR